LYFVTKLCVFVRNFFRAPLFGASYLTPISSAFVQIKPPAYEV
jgi:hypothetical protein